MFMTIEDATSILSPPLHYREFSNERTRVERRETFRKLRMKENFSKAFEGYFQWIIRAGENRTKATIIIAFCLRQYYSSVIVLFIFRTYLIQKFHHFRFTIYQNSRKRIPQNYRHSLLLLYYPCSIFQRESWQGNKRKKLEEHFSQW